MRNQNVVDAGFDLFAPGNEDDNSEPDSLHFYGPGHANKSPVNKVDFKICCSARMIKTKDRIFNTGFYMYPRSSLSKTQLRLANSVGIIDAGYRGHLMAMFDVINIPGDCNNLEVDYIGKKFDRYIQICAPGLVPILVEIVNKEDLGSETERGIGGFGSTGR
jgi:dUTP pyrophosphatase